MKALLPVYCRPLGYVILVVALFLPFILVMMGKVTDTNLTVLQGMYQASDDSRRALMILFAFSKKREPGDRADTQSRPRVMPFFSLCCLSLAECSIGWLREIW